MAWHDLVLKTGVFNTRNFSGFDFKKTRVDGGFLLLRTSSMAIEYTTLLFGYRHTNGMYVHSRYGRVCETDYGCIVSWTHPEGCSMTDSIIRCKFFAICVRNFRSLMVKPGPNRSGSIFPTPSDLV